MSSLSLALLLLVGDAAPAEPMSFAALDRDRSGSVTKAELRAAVQPVFARIDDDGSGYVTRTEMRGFAMRSMRSGERPAFMQGKRPRLKFDDQGRMSLDAFADALWQAQFAPRDKDGNGSVSAAEFAAR